MNETATKVARHALDIAARVAVGAAIYVASMNISRRVRTYRDHKAGLSDVNDTEK